MRKRTAAALAATVLAVVLTGGVTPMSAAYATGGHHGGGHTPVTICHHGKTITVDDSAVPAHLEHGDTLGACCPNPTPEPTTPIVTPEPEPTTPIETPTPAPTPTTPAPPADVVEPQVQDYVTCKGAAFVLDNSSSTVAVRYTVAGRPFDVPAGAVVHTDADGYLFPTDIGPYTITTYPGNRTWTFAPPTCQPTTPPTDEPTTPPTDEPTTPPTDEPTPGPGSEPSDEPSTPGSDASVPPTSPAPSDEPSAPATQPTPTVETPKPNASGTPSTPPAPVQARTLPGGSPEPVADSTSTRELAYTGTSGMLTGALFAVGLALVGAIVLVLRRAARTRANGGSDDR